MYDFSTLDLDGFEGFFSFKIIGTLMGLMCFNATCYVSSMIITFGQRILDYAHQQEGVSAFVGCNSRASKFETYYGDEELQWLLVGSPSIVLWWFFLKIWGLSPVS